MNEAEPNGQPRSPRGVRRLALALLIPLLACALQVFFRETIQRMGGRVLA